MNVAKKLTDLEGRAASLATAGAPGIAWRKDRLTNDELLRLETLMERCRRTERCDLSILTTAELREIRHLATLYEPATADADVPRLRELYALLAPYRGDGHSGWRGQVYTDRQAKAWLDEYERIAKPAKPQSK